MDPRILALRIAFIGFVAVCLVLYVFSLVKSGRKAYAHRVVSAASALPPEPQPPVEAEAEQDHTEDQEEDPEELVAVIAAALAAYLQQPVEQLRILSVQPAVGGAPAGLWKTAGRLRLMEDRLARQGRQR